MTNRLTAYTFVRDRGENDLPWTRIPEFAGMELPRPVVLVNGSFDVLHSGHMKVLFHARRRAGTLVVAMDSDDRTARKGEGRPVQSWVERATTMAFMPVDHIVEITSDRDFLRLLTVLQPDLRVQGWDYRKTTSKYPWIPKAFVRGTGMRTSKIVERCKKVMDEKS